MKRLFSFPAMLGVGLTLLTLLSIRGRFNDPDMWWHLKVGEAIVVNRSLPQVDEFSFTAKGHPWIPHSWLADVLIYSAYKLGGYVGVWVWQCGAASLIFLAVYALCCWYSGNAKVAFLGGLIGWFFGTVGLAARPLLLGHLFLVWELIILHFAAVRSRRWLWVLPPLFAVWVNCHGSYVVGLLVLAAYVLSSFIELSAGRLISIRADRGDRVKLCVALASSVAALMVNPLGWRLLAYPLDAAFGRSEGLSYVSEWQPVDVNDPRGIGLLAMAGAFGVIFLVRSKNIHLRELFLLIFAFASALRHSRMLFIFGILAAPVLCRLLADQWEAYDARRDNWIANGVIMALAVSIMVVAFPRLEFLEETVRANNPVRAVEFIRSTGLSGPMVNDYTWGGYLIWALPEHKVFVDGRADVFDWTGILPQYERWALLKEDPKILLDKYGVRYCLLQKGASMTHVLPYLPGWKQVYSDELAVIFARL